MTKIREVRRGTALAVLVSVCLALGLSIGCGPLTASQSGSRAEGSSARMKRIGYLHEGFRDDAAGPSETAFLEGMAALGYVDGQNIQIEYRYTEGKDDLARKYAGELVSEGVDAIVANGTIRIQAAKEATNSIPIVMTNAPDPVGTGLVESLARPGRNVTGLSTLSPGLAAKRVELMREMAPDSVRLAVFYNPDNNSSSLALRETLAAADLFGFEAQTYGARTLDELSTVLDAAAADGAQAQLATGDAIFYNGRRQIAEWGIQHGVPTHYNLRGSAVAGGLFVYGTDFPDLFRRSATYVHRILLGANAAEMPVEQPTKFELVINLSTARALGLTIPPNILAQATELIQ